MIVGILLAAGSSRRFGSQKLLQPLADGTSLALRCALNLAPAVDRMVMIIAPAAKELTDVLARVGGDIQTCARSVDGMGASLGCGIQASADAAGWLIALADMPFIQSASIAAVAQALRGGAPIAAPTYDGRRGHPVGFNREYYSELAALSGDTGAKDIVNRDRARIVLVPVDDPGIHRDIDTPEDLQASNAY